MVKSAAKFVRIAIMLVLLGTAFMGNLNAQALTNANLTGSWDCKTAAMNDHGKPGSGIEFKPGSMVYTFTDDGKWIMEANDATHTKKNGTYQLRKSALVLKVEDGSPYQDWQVDLVNGGAILVVKDKKLFLTFARLSPTP